MTKSLIILSTRKSQIGLMEVSLDHKLLKVKSHWLILGVKVKEILIDNAENYQP
jgi:hypothetical protein